jgi:hypothetical protein
VAKVTWTLGHVFRAGFALELTVDRAKKGIVETTIARLRPTLIHGLWIDNVAYAHALDFLGGQETELDFLDRADRRTRVREDKIRHFEVGVNSEIRIKYRDGKVVGETVVDELLRRVEVNVAIWRRVLDLAEEGQMARRKKENTLYDGVEK